MILELRELVAALSAKVAEYESREKIARQSAPFSKGVGKGEKKRPGRRAGVGDFSRRLEPEPGPSDMVEDIAVPLGVAFCPGCGGPLELCTERATTIDVPPEPVRAIRRFEVEVGRCRRCGKRVRGTHPYLPPDQFGATAHRAGPGVKAAALALHYHLGLPLRKVPEATLELTGIGITQGALTQAAQALCAQGGPLGEIYDDLRGEVAAAPVVNTDDTGWRIGGVAAYLMGFFTLTVAYFQIRSRHRHQEVREVIGKLFAGMLGTDRGTSYEAHDLAGIKQQKCLSHLLKNLSDVEKTKKGRARCFARDLKAALREGIALWQDLKTKKIGMGEYLARGKLLSAKLDDQLRVRHLTDTDNRRLLDGIGYQNDLGRVALFLEHPEIEPTNNRAERGLRPAVIARKVSHCSKNDAGAKTFAVMKTVASTIALRGGNVAQVLAELVRGSPMPEAQS